MIETQVSEITALQRQLAAKSTNLSQLTAKSVVLTIDVGRLKLHSAAGETVPKELMSDAETRERPAKHAKVTRWCAECSAISSTAAFSALLSERGGFKSRCEALTFESRCISELAAEAKELREKVLEHEKMDSTAHTTPNSLGKNRVTTANKWVVVLETNHAEAKIALARLVGVTSQSRAQTQPAETNLQSTSKRLSEV